MIVCYCINYEPNYVEFTTKDYCCHVCQDLMRHVQLYFTSTPPPLPPSKQFFPGFDIEHQTLRKHVQARDLKCDNNCIASKNETQP